MSSERKIAANRQNAKRSTGPRTSVGKKRVAHNSLRHGLTAKLLGPPVDDASVDRLAEALAEGIEDPSVYDLARLVAEAEAELLRARSARSQIVSRYFAFGGGDLSSKGDPNMLFVRVAYDMLYKDGKRDLSHENWFAFEDRLLTTQLANPAPLPANEPERTAEAFRRALVNLSKIERYERQAWSKRQRALGEFFRH